MGDYGNNQRVMGHEQQSFIIPKVKFTGKNIEEFVTKFSHIAEAYKVTRILYDNYGKHPPAPDTPEFQEWTAQDSRAYRLLEKHIDPEIWSFIRDKPIMSAREVFDVLTETCLRGTVRTTAQLEYDMEQVKMDSKSSLTSHFGLMCRFFRELHQAGQPLNDRQKIVKTMTKMSTRWYRIAQDYLATQPDEIEFDRFRLKMIQLEIDNRSHIGYDHHNNTEAAFFHSSHGPGRFANRGRTWWTFQGEQGVRAWRRGKGHQLKFSSRTRSNWQHQRERKDMGVLTKAGAQMNQQIYCSVTAAIEYGHISRDCPSRRNDQRCDNCGRRGHTATDCRQGRPMRNNQSAQVHAEEEEKDTTIQEGMWMIHEEESLLERAMITGQISPQTICIDGGATSHMVPYQLQEDNNILESYTEYTKPKKVIVGGGTFLLSRGEGTLDVNGHKFRKTLAVQGLQFILVSEPQIMMAGGMVVAKDSIKTIYNSEGQIVITAPLDINYRLFLVHKRDEIALLADSKVQNQMDLWHIRLGHANEKAIRQLVKATEGVDIPSKPQTFILRYVSSIEIDGETLLL
jgi:hypothetical protein